MFENVVLYNHAIYFRPIFFRKDSFWQLAVFNNLLLRVGLKVKIKTLIKKVFVKRLQTKLTTSFNNYAKPILKDVISICFITTTLLSHQNISIYRIAPIYYPPFFPTKTVYFLYMLAPFVLPQLQTYEFP